MQFNKILYFSLNEKVRASFLDYVKKGRYNFRDSFDVIDNDVKIEHVSQLVSLVDKAVDDLKDSGHLFVIIDYLSLCKGKTSYKTDSWVRASDIVRRAILKFPEVLFLFDESGVEHGTGEVSFDFTNFLFNHNIGFSKGVRLDYHKFSIIRKQSAPSDPFSFILLGHDNLFDGTNLRYAIKKFQYNILRVDRYNFSIIQQSRYYNLAFCIEDESSQNRFNGYALYANGFRVIPISSACELEYLNTQALDNSLKPQMIVRDFDLQFPDVPEKDPLFIDYRLEDDDSCPVRINQVDLIRGAKYFDKDSFFPIRRSTEKLDNKSGKPIIPSELLRKWITLNPTNENFHESNPYWSNLYDLPVFYISKGIDGIIDIQPDRRGHFKNNVSKQKVPGLYKPVSGLYSPIRHFYTVKERVYDMNHKNRVIKLNRCSNKPNRGKEQLYEVITKRENHEHGVPLDIYDLVNSMISRAKRCYKVGKYVRAAVIANEAIEVMNGFHEGLMLEAFYVKEICENSIAMNVVGGEDNYWRDDAEARVRIIEHEAERLLYRRSSDKHRYSLKYNVLNQIFSKCRTTCHDKEHFKAEEVFISAMGHLNEGYTPFDIIKSISVH